MCVLGIGTEGMVYLHSLISKSATSPECLIVHGY